MQEQELYWTREAAKECGEMPATRPVLATSDICSGNWPVLQDGESMLATAVLTRRNIRWLKGQFPLPDSPFLGCGGYLDHPFLNNDTQQENNQAL